MDSEWLSGARSASDGPSPGPQSWAFGERERERLFDLTPPFHELSWRFTICPLGSSHAINIATQKRGGGGAKGPQEQLVYTGENGALSSAALNIQTASWRLCCVKDGVRGEK